MYSFSLLWRIFYQGRRNQECYLLDYVCFKPSDDCKLSTELCAEIVQRNENLGLADYKFLLKIMAKSGVGEEGYCPKNILDGREKSPTHQDALIEMDGCFNATLDELFSKSGFAPSDVDVLVVSVSMFSPSPSLTSRIVRRYKMRDDVRVFCLSGMGCSAGVIAIDLVAGIFKSREKTLAVIVLSESITPNWYSGNDRSMMVSNCLFRSGGCSMLATNDPSLRHRAKMRLKCLVRTHLGASDDAYGCAVQDEDDAGRHGFRLSRSLPEVVLHALSRNLWTLAPRVLPATELVLYIARAVRQMLRRTKDPAAVRVNFKAGVEHFCLHPGGSAVIDGVGESLGLSDYDLEPARMALHRWGNTSASGLWYELGYMEAKKRLRRRDRVLMVSCGAGFECNSCLWEVLADLDEETGVWEDCMQNYPLQTLVNPFMEKYGWINDL